MSRLSYNLGTAYASGGRYKICWTSSANATNVEDFNVHAANFVMNGPKGRNYECDRIALTDA